MTYFRGLEELVKETIKTAIDEATKGTGTNVRFDIDYLARVMKAVGTADRFNAAIATCKSEMHHWIVKAADAQDMELLGRARAALALEEKLMAPRGRGYRPDGFGGFSPIV